MKLPNSKRAKEILRDLEIRFLAEEKITIEEIIKGYLKPINVYSYLLAKKRVRGWLSNLKRKIRKEYNFWLGSLNNEGQYGIVKTEGEARYALTKYYAQIKGNIRNSNLLGQESIKKELLLPEKVNKEQVLLTAIKNGEKIKK